MTSGSVGRAVIQGSCEDGLRFRNSAKDPIISHFTAKSTAIRLRRVNARTFTYSTEAGGLETVKSQTRSYVAWAVAIFVGGGLLALISPRPVQEAWTFEEANKHDIDSAVRVLAYDADEAIACGLLHLESLPSNARNGAFLDIDNDGDLDGFVLQRGASGGANVLFYMKLDGGYREISKRFGSIFTKLRDASELAFVDVGEDGLVDLVLRTHKASTEATTILRNHFDRRAYVALRLHPLEKAPSGTAAGASRVVVTAGDASLERCVPVETPGSETTLYVGLDSFEGAANVQVTWPEGQTSLYSGLAINRTHEIEQGSPGRVRRP